MTRKLRIGVAGVGVGAAEILPTMRMLETIDLVAAADVNPRILEVFRQRYGGATYGSVRELCADPNVEAVDVGSNDPYRRYYCRLAGEDAFGAGA